MSFKREKDITFEEEESVVSQTSESEERHETPPRRTKGRRPPTVSDESPKPIPKQRKKKYATPEEAKAAKLEQMRKWRAKKKALKQQLTITLSLPDLETREELKQAVHFLHSQCELSQKLQNTLSVVMQAVPPNQSPDEE